jgi:hypothetical protein
MINAICCLPFEAKVILRMKFNQKFVLMLDKSPNPIIDLASFWLENKKPFTKSKKGEKCEFEIEFPPSLPPSLKLRRAKKASEGKGGKKNESARYRLWCWVRLISVSVSFEEKRSECSRSRAHTRFFFCSPD